MPTISLAVIRGFVTDVVQNCSSEQCIKRVPHGSLHTLPHSLRNPLIAHGRNGPSHTDHHEKHLSNVKTTSINPSAHSHGQLPFPTRYLKVPSLSNLISHFPAALAPSPLPSPLLSSSPLPRVPPSLAGRVSSGSVPPFPLGSPRPAVPPVPLFPAPFPLRSLFRVLASTVLCLSLLPSTGPFLFPSNSLLILPSYISSS